MKKLILCILPLLLIGACAGNPIDVSPVSGFEKDRYLGEWYEVARLDHSFERGLTNVTATYTLRDDGKITVINKGYNEEKGKFESAKGKAKFKQGSTIGYLKVSFFGPFYGDYIIFGLDKQNYQYAFISGGKDNYLWLLSRTPKVSDDVRKNFLQQSKALGYDTNSLIWVKQDRH